MATPVLTKALAFTYSITGSSVNYSVSVSSSESSAAGADAVGQLQTVPTSWTAVDFGNCGTTEEFAIKNVDDTNYIQIATANDNTGVFARIASGKGIVIITEATATYYAKANTASVQIAIVAAEA